MRSIQAVCIQQNCRPSYLPTAARLMPLTLLAFVLQPSSRTQCFPQRVLTSKFARSPGVCRPYHHGLHHHCLRVLDQVSRRFVVSRLSRACWYTRPRCVCLLLRVHFFVLAQQLTSCASSVPCLFISPHCLASLVISLTTGDPFPSPLVCSPPAVPCSSEPNDDSVGTIPSAHRHVYGAPK